MIFIIGIAEGDPERLPCLSFGEALKNVFVVCASFRPACRRRLGQRQDVNHVFRFLPGLDQPGQRIRLSSLLCGHG